MNLVFDRICVDMPEGRECFPPDVFILKPVHLRVQYMLEKRLSFWLQGIEVDIKTALSNYRQWSVAKLAVMPARL